MKYRVQLLPPAVENLQRYYRRAARHAPVTAARCFNRFIRELDSLELNPSRCGYALENYKVSMEVRQLLFGRRPHVYRAVFTITGDKVRILRIRHGARQALTRREIEDADRAGDSQ